MYNKKKTIRKMRMNFMGLTHFDEHGKAIMVDVTEKSDTVRGSHSGREDYG